MDSTRSAEEIGRIVIVGGGTAGWMTATALVRMLRRKPEVVLIESDQIGTIGVGEATIPSLHIFNSLLDCREDEFMRRTKATFKLGIEFRNWGALGECYYHGFSRVGRDQPFTRFHQHWLGMRQAGQDCGDIAEYSINNMAMRAGKFARARTDVPNSPLSDIRHAFHFDAGLYAAFLRGIAEANGVTRIEGRIVDTALRGGDGFIESVLLEGGQRVAGDLFIDCSGLAGLLIEKVLHAGFEDWSQWLPCDRALAMPTASAGPLTPFTRASAHKAGWQWRIPLQHRVGNGHVFSSRFISEDEAEAVLRAHVDGEALAEARLIKFCSGKRKKMWLKNCVAIGLSGGFLEPLESTSIHMVQSAIARLVEYFPDKAFARADIDTYNRQADFEYERIRDFLILHYKQTGRTDSPFWDYCREMSVPDSLRERIALFKSHGRLIRENNELFSEENWLQVLMGQGVRPERCHPLAGQRGAAETAEVLDDMRRVVRACVEAMPSHAQYLSAMLRQNANQAEFA
ncbi:MAG TPA: tryptophan halogenase family protein [Burkholderiaceae bacterium]